MKKSKIIYITDEILTENNAPTMHVIEVCMNLAELGHDIELLAPSLSTFKTSRFKVQYIPMLKSIKSLIFHPLLVSVLAKKLLTKEADVVYIRHFPLLILPILLCKLLQVPCILEVNGKIVDETNHGSQKQLLSKGYNLLNLINFNFATKIITVTTGIKTHLQERYGIKEEKMFVVENGINLKKFKPVNKYKARKKIGLTKNDIYIGYVGSFYKYQGLEYIIQSAKEIFKRRKNIKFIIIGNGPKNEKEKLLEQIKELKLQSTVKLFGPVKHEEVIQYINAFDICLCYPTSFRNNATSPFKLFEYLACGKTVICSNIAGLREYFEDAILYTEPDNARKLTEKILYVLENPTIKIKLEKNSQKFIKNHTWKNVTKRISKLIDEQIEIKTIKKFDYEINI
jgi:glycosyltransferase involved in cell wall biosynthesis